MNNLFKILLSIAIFLTAAGNIYSQKTAFKKQLSFSLGMGIDYLASPSYTQFIRNEIPYFTSDSVKTYNAGVEFFGALEYDLAKQVSGAFDYSYFLRSSNYNFTYYIFDYTITSHQPNLMLYYNLSYPGFKFKIGIGGGYHLYSLENNINGSGNASYTSSGPSAKIELLFAPVLSKKLGAYVSAFYRGNFSSALKDSDGKVLKSSTGEEVNLNSYGPGARLGFTFYLN